MKHKKRQRRIKQSFSRLDASQEWGTYFIGKYYFRIATKEKRINYGLTPESRNLSIEMQLKLQKENFAALFHEYIHYFHESSTVIGNIGLALDLVTKSLFTNWINKDENSSKSMGLDRNDSYQMDMHIKAGITKEVILGETYKVLKGAFIKVIDIEYINQEVYFPHGTSYMSSEISIPKVKFSELVNYKIKSNYLLFGKYFIYEGLAYELDRIVDSQINNFTNINDYMKGTEYTVLRRIAQSVFPEIEKRVYLSLASMSLQYVDCGRTFIDFIKRVKVEYEKGTPQLETTNLIKLRTSEILNSKRQDFRDAQDEFKNVYLKRVLMYKALDYLTNNMKSLYDERIKNPTFEIDYVFDNEYRKLFDKVQICDYIYTFTDDEDYMRDFMGTSINVDISESLKVLATNFDYYAKHYTMPTDLVEKSNNQCPFFYTCDHPLRVSHTELCANKPWRIYEASINDRCWYGVGVLETKGVDSK